MKTYRVTGPFAFRGNSSGETFEAKADAGIERAIERGSISEATPDNPTPPAPPAEPAKPKPAEKAGPSGTAGKTKEEK